MVNWVMQSSHWSPVQGYANGEVLINLMRNRWEVVSISPTQSETRAVLYLVTLKRCDELISLVALDGPVVNGIATDFARAALPLKAVPAA